MQQACLPSCRGRRTPAPRGLSAGRSASVLIVTLWTLFFLAALAVAVSGHVSAATRLAGALRADAAGRAAAQAGLEAAIMEALAETNVMGLAETSWNNDAARFSGSVDDAPAAGGGERALGAYRILYTYAGEEGTATNTGVTSEAARINLNELGNRSNRAMLKALLERAGGLDGRAADALVVSIRDWCDADDEERDAQLTGGSESGYYAALSAPYACHNGRLESMEELLLVNGVDPALCDAIAPYVTVYGTGEKIHVNLADPVVLECAARGAGVDAAEVEGLVSDVVRARPRPTLAAFSEVLGNTAPWQRMRRLLTTEADTVSGTACGRPAGAGRDTVRIAFAFDAGAGKMVYWNER
ncbi:MAG: general secretion pathway protein GspK [Lentisphaerae bacterium]|nr:general secretion pathway protein GspK [Lentisphaerota bacterium]